MIEPTLHVIPVTEHFTAPVEQVTHVRVRNLAQDLFTVDILPTIIAVWVGSNGSIQRKPRWQGALVARARRFAAVIHHLVLHHDPLVPHGRHEPFRLCEWAIRPVCEATIDVGVVKPGDDLRSFQQIVFKQTRLAHDAEQPGRCVQVPHTTETRRIEMTSILHLCGTLQIEQHHVGHCIAGTTPVFFRMVHESLVEKHIV